MNQDLGVCICLFVNVLISSSVRFKFHAGITRGNSIDCSVKEGRKNLAILLLDTKAYEFLNATILFRIFITILLIISLLTTQTIYRKFHRI